VVWEQRWEPEGLLLCIPHWNNCTTHLTYVFIIWKVDTSLLVMFNPLYSSNCLKRTFAIKVATMKITTFCRDDNISYEAAFQLCPDYTQYTICSQLNSWVAEAIGVKFLASRKKPQMGTEPTIFITNGTITCLPQNRHFSWRVKMKDTQRRTLVSPWRMHCMYSGMEKGTSRGEAMPNSEKIKPISLAIVELRESEGIRQLVSQ